MTNLTVQLHHTLCAMMSYVDRREDGQDMVEYALLASLLSIVAIAAIFLVGPAMQHLFSHIAGALRAA
ncbi:MAG: Flp family type IVb pilin [Chloroflexota bacterium]